MLGGSSLFQLIFAGYLSNYSLKKKFLLIGINLRVVSLLCLALVFFMAYWISGQMLIILIFLLISVFSFSGSFANVSYVDIMGKSIQENKRKKLFTTKEIINSIGIFASAMIVRELLITFEFPNNYSILFLIAGLLLGIASLGFWRIHEIKSIIKKKRGFWEFFSKIPSEIKKNVNLKYYLLIINSLGLGLSILPFFILFAKDNFGLSYQMIGDYLLFRTIGMLVAGLFLFKNSKHFQYKNLLKFSLILAALLPLISLALKDLQQIYQFIFIFSGIFVAAYKVAVHGLLLEISTNENRAVYAGISGAGNIVTTLFPLFAGFLISIIGYNLVYLSVTVIILSSYFFRDKIEMQTSHSIIEDKI